MKRFVTGLLIGCCMTIGATALAGNFTSVFKPVRCAPSNIGATCTIPAIGRAQVYYTINIPELDLSCLMAPDDPSHGISKGLGCDRLSGGLKCIDGVFGSWGTRITARRIEVDSTQPCVTTTAPPYYKLTGSYRSHVYYRNP